MCVCGFSDNVCTNKRAYVCTVFIFNVFVMNVRAAFITLTILMSSTLTIINAILFGMDGTHMNGVDIER